ncbi:MAG: hypothetical protein M1837_003613 [Sclerophora amabilis]|nr:MAG: hypothetical protein M1837_003613 [Sclerophora amabilis]
MKCTVSWNHLIDYQMHQGMVKSSIRTYNEMKKRGQTPDAYTFTLLFRGLANHSSYGSAVGKALSLYHSMHEPKSPVQPTILHTNAVLKVCARAKDMDSMWGVAAKLPEHGMGAPDAVTFTTLLNAILQNARTYVSEESEWARRGRRIAAVREGRRMWDDIVGRWRDGELQMDEDLVCAMGRLLLLGRDRRDWDDVLSLVEQTMNIPRPVPRVLERDAKKEARMEAIEGAKRGLATGEKEESRIEAREEERFTAVKDEALEAGMELNEDEEGSDPHQEEEEEEEALSPEEETTEDADGKWYNERQFKPIAVNPKDPGKRRKIEVIGFASPGPNTLSLVLEACAAAHTLKVGTTYWELFTNGEGGLAIRPDLENYHVYLRMLRSSRSSGKVLELVRDQLIAKTGLTPAKKTFHIALSVCKRDSNNPHVFENADQLVELMHRTVPDQDIMSLVTYLDLAALVAGPSDRKNPSRTNPDPIIRALKRLESVFQNVKSMIYYGRSTDMKFPTELERSSVVLLARRMLGLYDRLIGDGLVRREMYGHYAGQKRSLSTFLTKVMHGDEMMRARKKEKSGKDERSTAAAAAAAARRIEDDDADWNSP